VFWTDYRGVGIWAKGAPDAMRITTEAAYKGAGLAIDGPDVYWSEYTVDGKGHIHHGTIGMSSINPDPDFVQLDRWPGQLAVDTTRIYWIDRASGAQDSIQWVARNDLKSGTPKQLLTAAMGKTLGGPIMVDTPGNYVYFIEIENGDSNTFRANKPGGPLVHEAMANQPFNEQWLFGDAKRIYLVTPKNGFNPEVGQIDWVAR
jgi:hypothetical protein